jgi:hypothetical protein
MESGAAQLLSTAMSDGLSDPFDSANGGWIVGWQEVDPYTNGAWGSELSNPFIGRDVNPYTDVPPEGANPNAFTGGQDVNPFSGFQNTAFSGVAPIDTSQMLASNGPIVTNDATSSSRYAPASILSGQTPIDTVTIDGDQYAHFQITLDGVAYDAYANDKVIPGKVWLVPSAPAAVPPAAPPPVTAQAGQRGAPAATQPATPAGSSAPTGTPAGPDWSRLNEWSFAGPNAGRLRTLLGASPSVGLRQPLEPISVPFYQVLSHPEWWDRQIDPAVIEGFNEGLSRHQNLWVPIAVMNGAVIAVWVGLEAAGAAAAVSAAAGETSLQFAAGSPRLAGGLTTLAEGLAETPTGAGNALATTAGATVGTAAITNTVIEEVTEDSLPSIRNIGALPHSELETDAAQRAGQALGAELGASLPPPPRSTGAVLIENSRRGNAFQTFVTRVFGLPRNTKAVFGTESGALRATIPDVHDVAGGTPVGDIKDVLRLFFTGQLRAQENYAVATKTSFNIIVSQRTQSVSQPLVDAVQKSGGFIFRVDPSSRTVEVWDAANRTWVQFLGGGWGF